MANEERSGEAGKKNAFLRERAVVWALSHAGRMNCRITPRARGCTWTCLPLSIYAAWVEHRRCLLDWLQSVRR